VDRVLAIASSIGFFISLLFLALFVWHIHSLRSALSSCSEQRIAVGDELAWSDSRGALMQRIKINRWTPSTLERISTRPA
jgi:hypothetical protein